ncbi:hypothetical protein [Alkaliphilus hydrothermalis]|uniref:N-acetyltransferase domain-containing protein n=1 Tax=Alkaliphilus hydrothermalis TaxID=1482730 RepID=A0ABS2NLV4_9FIRM|nr:hypothetical protein [Alkaliphilus hydrothermalis]MBM7613919.1 hypothetical protein [Alkaliphilus hydrothermalis]
MGKKIEIELNNQLFEKINQLAEAKSMKLEDYLISLIKGNEGLQNQKLKDYQGYVIKELEALLDKVKGRDGNGNSQQQKSKVLIYSYKTYRNELQKEIKDIVEFYKRKGWFNEDFFYLIQDRRGIVGYMGLNPQREELPYGGYMFLYSLHVAKSHQGQQNFKYISGFIHAVAKKEKYYSVDISSVSTNIEEKDLLSVGFKKFDTATLLRGKVELVDNEKIEDEKIVNELVDKRKQYEVFKLETKKIKLSDVIEKGYLSSGRMLPLGFLFAEWQKKEQKLEIRQLKIKVQQKEIELILVEEGVEQGQDEIFQYTLLVEPNILFDEEILRHLYIEIIGDLVNQKSGKKIQLMVPEGLAEDIKFIEKEGKKKVLWYRMMVI